MFFLCSVSLQILFILHFFLFLYKQQVFFFFSRIARSILRMLFMFIKSFFTPLGPVSIYARSGLDALWAVFLSNCAGGAVTVFTAL